MWIFIFVFCFSHKQYKKNDWKWILFLHTHKDYSFVTNKNKKDLCIRIGFDLFVQYFYSHVSQTKVVKFVFFSSNSLSDMREREVKKVILICFFSVHFFLSLHIFSPPSNRHNSWNDGLENTIIITTTIISYPHYLFLLTKNLLFMNSFLFLCTEFLYSH